MNSLLTGVDENHQFKITLLITTTSFHNLIQNRFYSFAANQLFAKMMINTGIVASQGGTNSKLIIKLLNPQFTNFVVHCEFNQLHLSGYVNELQDKNSVLTSDENLFQVMRFSNQQPSTSWFPMVNDNLDLSFLKIAQESWPQTFYLKSVLKFDGTHNFNAGLGVLITMLNGAAQQDKDYVHNNLTTTTIHQILNQSLKHQFSDHPFIATIKWQPAYPLQFGCWCSQDAAQQLVNNLATNNSTVWINNQEIEITCQFCNTKYIIKHPI